MKYPSTFTSCTNTHVKYDLYLPLVLIRQKAVIQIHHGMGEHSGRYQHFAEYLAEEGFVVVVSDFPGHGSSLFNFEQGYFGVGDPTNTLVEDMHRLRGIICRRFPDLQYFILGNQLGSFVLRKYISLYGDFIQGAIMMGTGGKLNSVFKKSTLKVSSLFKGKMHRSKSVKSSIQKRLNLSFGPTKTAVDYLTRDPQERKKYQDDSMTDFIYTNKSYNDIFRLVKVAANAEVIKKVPQYLSLLIISGEKDVFGNMGNGPKWLCKEYQKVGIRDLELKLYPDSRHDILHELNRKEVYADILSWLNERTYI